MFRRESAGRAVTAAAIADPAPVPGQPGAWYVYRCDRTGVVDALYRAPVWIPDRQPGVAPSPAQLAEQSRSQLLLPSPRIEANPVGAQLVNLPTWLWLDPASWGPRSAIAQVPGVSVTAVARPTSVHEPGHRVLMQRQVRLAGTQCLHPATMVVEQLAGLAALDPLRPKTTGQARTTRTYPHSRSR